MEAKTRTLVRLMGVAVYSATPFFYFQNLFLCSYFCYSFSTGKNLILTRRKRERNSDRPIPLDKLS